ncbi:AAA family ATPase [Polyangium fumosum]|uniref:Endonuclease GajA/Old nuclease/RecF-like AAA domain-containing protein n=1 Tax=Polyangium fumosum TaxID=889272 RepID=A0A4U1JFT5_9BACT|nr:AAA family ATPase [Polyangium fumosum]TKD09967.1 hypothetical protein E8A74_10175 [Polyangium fumosum]
MGLEALRVKNLRSLSDTPQIPIRPITVLVGRNSSGKSTFLRTFPLLKQSVERPTESPILWYLQRRIDFGTLNNAINDRATERTVTFEFTVLLPLSTEVTLRDTPPRFHVSMTLAEGQPPHGSFVQGYDITQPDFAVTASLRFSPTGRLLSFTVDGADMMPQDLDMALSGIAYLLPNIRPGSHGKVKYQPVVPPLHLDPPKWRDTDYDEALLNELARSLRPLYHGKTHDKTLVEIADHVSLGGHDAMWQHLERDSGLSVKKDARKDGHFGHVFQEIFYRTFARLVPWVLDAADMQIADFMSRVAYLAPLRATADRSYRLQDISVDDVDPDGQNLAMFMYSLSEAERASFAAFTEEHLEFESKIDISGLNAEILVREPGGSRHINLVDIGFGYTEVLPLMAILWSTCCRERGADDPPTSLLAIEQPELHLHPAHQVKLAGAIASAWRTSRDAGREVKIMVETHSEGIVNGLGALIQKGVIGAEDVQIVIFDQDPETRQTDVRIAGYTPDGALNDAWPFGFFAPVADG